MKLNFWRLYKKFVNNIKSETDMYVMITSLTSVVLGFSMLVHNFVEWHIELREFRFEICMFFVFWLPAIIQYFREKDNKSNGRKQNG